MFTSYLHMSSVGITIYIIVSFSSVSLLASLPFIICPRNPTTLLPCVSLHVSMLMWDQTKMCTYLNSFTCSVICPLNLITPETLHVHWCCHCTLLRPVTYVVFEVSYFLSDILGKLTYSVFTTFILVSFFFVEWDSSCFSPVFRHIPFFLS